MNLKSLRLRGIKVPEDGQHPPRVPSFLSEDELEAIRISDSWLPEYMRHGPYRTIRQLLEHIEALDDEWGMRSE